MKAEDIITESLKSKIFELLQKEKESIPLFIPVILGMGILFGVYFPKYACYTLIFMVVAFFLKKTRLYAIVFCLGVYVSQTGGILNTERLTEKKFLENNVEKVIFFADTDFIEETHPTMKNMQRIIFNNIEFDKNMDKIDLNFIKTIKMTCSSKLIKNISPLDRVKVIGCLNKFKTSSFPMSFDQKQFSAITKIDTNGVAFFIEKQNTKKKKYDFNGYFSYYRFLLTKLISEKMDSQSHGVASALLTGDKSSIKPEIREKFIK